jgi:hypothetical protein
VADNEAKFRDVSKATLQKATYVLMAWVQKDEHLFIADDDHQPEQRKVLSKREIQRLVRHHWSVVFMEAGSKWLGNACFIDASKFLKPFSLGGPDVFRKDYGDVEDGLPLDKQRPKTWRRRKPLR